MQASFQYGANTAIKNETGKDVLTHFKDVVEEEQDNKKLELKIKDIATNTIEKVKKNIPKINVYHVNDLINFLKFLYTNNRLQLHKITEEDKKKKL